jgi:DNA/RNA-binding domain of Phe-tRNA-synthetase-like protein
MTEDLELRAAAGFVEATVKAELPGLRLDWVTVDGRRRRSPREVVRRLRDLSNRYRGEHVVALRAQPITHAYRTFFHQIGLDPDVTRTPLEQAALRRLLHGGFRSHDLVDDALLIAVVETGVPVWALNADLVDAGGLGIRTTTGGDRLGSTEYGSYLQPGRLVVADARWVHSVLFGEIAPGHEVRARTERIVLFSIGVEGVPAIHVEEALWVCTEVLSSATR